MNGDRPKPYIRGRYARGACDLRDWLHDQKIPNHGVAYPDRNRNNTLEVYLHHAADVLKVPKAFMGFTVVTTVGDPTESLGDG